MNTLDDYITEYLEAYLELFRKADLLKHPEYLQQIGYHTPEANLG